MPVHIVKLCVGADSVEDLSRWQSDAQKGRPVCGTRSWPKRRDEILKGGSLYWVIKGMILVRQPVLAIEEVEDSFGRRCGFYLDPVLTRTIPHPKRAFQGWRYLDAKDAPADLPASFGDGLPEDLARKLADLGAL